MELQDDWYHAIFQRKFHNLQSKIQNPNTQSVSIRCQLAEAVYPYCRWSSSLYSRFYSALFWFFACTNECITVCKQTQSKWQKWSKQQWSKNLMQNRKPLIMWLCAPILMILLFRRKIKPKYNPILFFLFVCTFLLNI